MSDGERRIVELRVNETAARQQVSLRHQSTTTLRLSGPRPLQVFEVDGKGGFHPGGSVPLPQPPSGAPAASAVGAIAAALAHAAARPGIDVCLRLRFLPSGQPVSSSSPSFLCDPFDGRTAAGTDLLWHRHDGA